MLISQKKYYNLYAYNVFLTDNLFNPLQQCQILLTMNPTTALDMPTKV